MRTTRRWMRHPTKPHSLPYTAGNGPVFDADADHLEWPVLVNLRTDLNLERVAATGAMPLKGSLAAIPTLSRQLWNKQADSPQNRKHPMLSHLIAFIDALRFFAAHKHH